MVKAVFSPLIFWLYLFGTTVGGLYSVPPFQASLAPRARAPSLPRLPHAPCPMPPPRRAAWCVDSGVSLWRSSHTFDARYCPLNTSPHHAATPRPLTAPMLRAAQALPSGCGPHHRHLPRLPPQLRRLLRHARGAPRAPRSLRHSLPPPPPPTPPTPPTPFTPPTPLTPLAPLAPPPPLPPLSPLSPLSPLPHPSHPCPTPSRGRRSGSASCGTLR